MSEDKWESLRKSPYATKGYFKLWNAFCDLIKKEKFLLDVAKIRKSKGIPKEEFKSYEEWLISHKVHKVVDKLCEKYGFDKVFYGDTFYEFIFYNRIDPPSIDISTCEIVDIFDPVYTDTFDKHYPIALRISPYSSLREIQDYLNKNYHLIKGIQDKYKDPKSIMGRSKKKSSKIEERNEFIYQNRHLPRREIMTLVGNNFGAMEYGYIGKIISLETKKRKEL